MRSTAAQKAEALGEHDLERDCARSRSWNAIRRIATVTSKGLFLAQRFARHVSPLTTTIYTHPSDQELFAQIRRLHC